MYTPQRHAESEFIPIRKLRYHVLRWGSAPAADSHKPLLVMMHGWMDVAASFQFIVDAFSADFLRDRTLIASDWRGYGLSGLTPEQSLTGPVPETGVAYTCHDSYWFPDYLADLDALLDHYAPGQAVDLLGHSMGGHVVSLYAGARPQRIRHLINLEGYGLPATQAEQAPERYAQWMDELQQRDRGDITLTVYASAEAVAQRLMRTNQRLPLDKALWLAHQWSRPDAQGRWHILGDVAHKLVNPQLYRAEEAVACYRRISAPTLLIHASDDHLQQVWQGRYPQAEMLERLRHIPQLQRHTMPDTGHMLHHDQPQALAQLIEQFLGA